MSLVDRTVVVYPGDTQGWVRHLERLAQELQGSRLDASEVLRELDAVYAAALACEQRGDDPW